MDNRITEKEICLCWIEWPIHEIYLFRISEGKWEIIQDSLLDYNLTKANVDDGNNSDLRDSDGVLNGNNADATVLSQDIPQSGANNHSFDFGFTKT